MGIVPQPISDEQAETLYEAIFVGLGEGSKPYVESCDHTLRYADTWAAQNCIEAESFHVWLHDNGGFCDCEVLFNVMPDDDEAEDR